MVIYMLKNEMLHIDKKYVIEYIERIYVFGEHK